ncbi:unnamed protein product [Clonostachys chloroleuca]|uniref:Uncharacterized protein n=1 Tax=Clonostachys chloroleuca TaxID=1926264 RepID=A0AA35LQP7_9HYPO|nr:unnamed protein product [Clonostachys chloroleuca]
MKLGHYNKIPPRLMVASQLVATVVSVIASLGIINSQLTGMPGGSVATWLKAGPHPLSEELWVPQGSLEAMHSTGSSLGPFLLVLYGLLPGTWPDNAGPTASSDFAILSFSFAGLTNQEISFPEWWGTTKYMETCDFQDCRWLAVNPGEAIGPAEWH